MSRAWAYYNEIDPGKAATLRELVRVGAVAAGEVDERSIVDVQADDVRGFVQCHWFAGVGVWSYALRLARWPDDRPVWTGSCPCQPFSIAGKRLGRDDPRHLAPAWLGLIAECAPVQVFGEQVGDAVKAGWLDNLQDNLEMEGYACGSATFPACSIGAPHIRQRLYFGAVRLADSDRHGPQGAEPTVAPGGGRRFADAGAARDDRLDDTIGAGLEGQPRHGDGSHEPGRNGTVAPRSVAATGTVGGLADRERNGWGKGRRGDNRGDDRAQLASDGGNARPGPTNGFWRDADWLHGRDGRWRPVGPGTFPLAHGAAARVGRLRAYGDAIVAPQAAAFIADFEAAAGEVLA